MISFHVSMIKLKYFIKIQIIYRKRGIYDLYQIVFYIMYHSHWFGWINRFKRNVGKENTLLCLGPRNSILFQSVFQ